MINTIIVVISYFIGNFSSAFFVAKYSAGIDIRNFGSGNAGATNVLRTLGKKEAAIAFIGDILKGVIAVIVGRFLGGSTGEVLAGVFVVVGHNWPVFLGFKGGKGIATTIGVMLAIKPVIVFVCAIIGSYVLYRTKYVSLGSIGGIVAYPILMIITLAPFKYILMSIFLSFMAVYRHRENIKRVKNGTEHKIGEKVRRVK